MDRRRLDFMSLWFGQTVSQFGSQVTLIALPLIALLVLRGSPLEIGLMTAAGGVSYLGFGLLAGAIVDRISRKRLAIACDLGRFVVLLIVPVLAWAGRLTFLDLYVVSFLLGTLTVFFEVAYRSLLPSLVKRDQLVAANSKLEGSYAAAQMAGPALGGGMVQLLSAPTALLADSISFLVSALSLSFVSATGRVDKDALKPSLHQLAKEISEGLGFVWSHPVLRPFAYCSAIWNVAQSAVLAEFLVFTTRTLHLAPYASGGVLAGSGLGALLAAILSPRIVRRLGLGRTLVLGPAVAAFGTVAFPVAHGPTWLLILVLGVGWVMFGFGETTFGIQMVSVRQMVTPDSLLGRMDASMRLFFRGAIPVGATVGGLLAQGIGLRATLLCTAALFAATVILIGRSRLRDLDLSNVRIFTTALAPGQ